MNFKQYTIALLIVLFCAGSVIVGIRSALTSETSDYTSLPDKEQGFVEYQGSPYSTVYYSAPAQGTKVAVPMRSVNSGILRHSQPSYYAGASMEYRVSAGNYASQGLYQTSHQMYSYGGASAGGYAGRGNTGLHTAETSAVGYAGFASATILDGGYTTNQSSTVTPMLAYVPMQAEVGTSAPARHSVRRIPQETQGTLLGTIQEDDGKWWYWNGEEWVETTTKIENGQVWVWNGSTWVLAPNQASPDSPIGDTPWLFFGLLVAGYIVVVTRKRTKRQRLPFLLIALSVLPAWAEAGDSCNDPIRLGKDYKTTITQTGTVHYVANTIDLPLSVYFATTTPDLPPEVEMDFTCDKGVYEDSILCSLFCPKGGSGGVTIEMPHKPKLQYKLLDDGRHCYYISMGKAYRDMLFQAGLDHDVDVHIKVIYHSLGDMSMAPDGMFANCMDGSKFMHIGDTVHIHADDLSRHVVMPYIQWQNDSIRYIWHGDKDLTLAIATECDFDPLDYNNANVVDRFPMRPADTVKVTSAEMQYYVSSGAYANEAGMFFAKWYTGGDGILTVERVPLTPPDGGAVLMQYDKATPVTPSDTTNALYAISRAVNSFTQFVSHTDHVIRMWVGTTPALSAENAIGTYTFVATDEGQVLNMDSLTLSALWQQTKGNYLYLRIWCTAKTSVTPHRWAPSDCASAKQPLFIGTKRIDRSSNEVFKMLYSEWRGGDILIQSNKTQKYQIYVADTCQVYTSANNRHKVYVNTTLTKRKPVTVTADTMVSWADRVDADGYLYWRFFNTSTSSDITVTRYAPEPVDPVPEQHPSAQVTIRCIGTPDGNGAQQVEIRANTELHLRLVDANGKRINEWDAWKNAAPMLLTLKQGSYQLLTDNESITINIPSSR